MVNALWLNNGEGRVKHTCFLCPTLPWSAVNQPAEVLKSSYGIFAINSNGIGFPVF